MPWLGAVIAGVGGAINAGAAAEAAGQQERAFDEASGSVRNQLQGDIRQAGIERNRQLGMLDQAGGTAFGQLNQGYGAGINTLGLAGNQANQTLAGGYGGARTDVLGGAAGAAGAYGQLAGLQVQGGNAVQNLMANPSSFQTDPGYQFRLQQGERALGAGAAARGGRGGGRAMKELAEFNQGLASQEFAASFQRATQADQMANQLGLANANFQAQGLQGLAGLSTSTGAQLAGLNTGLAGLQSQNQLGIGQQISGLQVGQGTAQSGITLGLAGQQIGIRQNAAMQQQQLRQGQYELELAKAGYAGQGLAAATNQHGAALGAAVSGAGYIPAGGSSGGGMQGYAPQSNGTYGPAMPTGGGMGR